MTGQPTTSLHEPISPQDLAPDAGVQGKLDALVTRVARNFMEASAGTMAAALGNALQAMTEFFGTDTSFLRRHDIPRSLSILVSEWPPRPVVPDPDPLGAVPFDVDPVFAASKELREPFVIRPGGSTDAYQERVKTGTGVDGVSMAMVPLLQSQETVGVLGFVKFGDRPWSTRELNALQAIASLIVQLQARVDAEERLQFNAYHDSLTGLPNRRALLEHLDSRLDDPATTTTTVLFLDLDRFKSMNGFLGHRAGDLLLTTVGARLQAEVGDEGFVARLAGDEFVLAYDGVDTEATAAIADRMLGAVRRPLLMAEHQISRTASLGIATAEGIIQSDELLRNADVAMRRAKKAGGDRAIVFDDTLRQAEDERSSTELGLRNAIDNDELVLHFQPEVDLRTGELRAFEALVRWDRPGHGLLPAGAFITVAEETGLIVDLGRWVLREACRQMAEWRAQHPEREFTMRVNLSPAQLATHNIVELVAESLEANDLPGSYVCFEITEHAVMENVQQATEALHALRALGVTFAIDDFGTGFSSLAQLKRLPVDVLKIDQTFVRGLGTDEGDTAIVDATIRLGRSFGLDVVAEGIETHALLDELVALGCERGQGYLLMRPAGVEMLEDLLVSGRIDLDALVDPPSA
jgi:diguanylate cyclase (GGDEF)-like protein